MELGNYNASIGCTVEECKYHTNNDYCSLDHIKVVNSSESNLSNSIKTQEITDCASFEAK
ncbi:hypothetical protein SH1V18_05210 [Vallitalea longa]|uniref:DUF1540 domain-containing protein n=1 Tax=Vallitalea longa TaxID=2936439 RepID=A0A9W5Y8M3_9FIRM|nr:DUF1540 domain-containing protein [Vallitalea longa]GKX28041.1 hypothetical protein SH1V18_05210 [Vallitalea longa]